MPWDVLRVQMRSSTHALNVNIVCGPLHILAALLHERAPCTNQTADSVGPQASLNAAQRVKTSAPAENQSTVPSLSSL